MKYSSLRDLKPGVEAIVSGVLIKGERGEYLIELGILPGFEIKKIRNFWFGSSVIRVGNSSYAIGKDLCENIFVRYE